MKNLPFHRRFRFALQGWRTAFRGEASFRFQVLAGAGVLAAIAALRPEPLWCALLLLCAGAVLAAELFNTALERLVDRLHPERHPEIAAAKDCAAGAVLALSVVSAIVFAVFLLDRFG